MSRIIAAILLLAGVSLSGPVLAGNFCTKDAGDPQLSFPGTNDHDVIGVKGDPTLGYTLFLCSPGDLDISWLTGYSFADFNHDGWEDLLFGVKKSSGGEVQLFLNDKTGSGTVVLSATLPTGAAAAPNVVDTLDIDGDGWPDIVTANGSDGTFSVMLNDGSGAFPSVKQYAAGSDVGLLAVVDVNGDNYPDVITLSTQDQTVSVFLNKGDGTFATPTIYPVGGPVSSLSVADINGDGHPDIYVTSVAEINIFAPPPPSSTTGGTQKLLNNGDGTFTVSAWQAYSSGLSGSLSVSGADLTITATDLSGLVGAAGSPPVSGGITATSGGKITLPTGTMATVTTSGSKTSSASGGSSKNGAPSAGTGSSGGGEMEWLSLTLLGLAGLLRRKRA